MENGNFTSGLLSIQLRLACLLDAAGGDRLARIIDGLACLPEGPREEALGEFERAVTERGAEVAASEGADDAETRRRIDELCDEIVAAGLPVGLPVGTSRGRPYPLLSVIEGGVGRGHAPERRRAGRAAGRGAARREGPPAHLRLV